MKSSTISRSVEILRTVEFGASSRGLPRKTQIMTIYKKRGRNLSLVSQNKRKDTFENIKC